MFVGIGIIMIGDRGSHLRRLVDEGASLLQYIVSGISYLIPLFVFTMLLQQFWSGELGRLLSVWKPILLTYIIYLILAAVFCVITSLRLRCSPLSVLRSCMPPFIIGLSTASSISSLSLGMETCEKKFGVDHNTVSFAFPLSSVIFKPASTAFFAVFSFCFAEIYHLDISASWLILVMLLVPLLTMALPPIAGSGILAFSILFGRLGIPAEALVVVSAVEVLSDFVDTGFNVMLRVMHLAANASEPGKNKS